MIKKTSEKIISEKRENCTLDTQVSLNSTNDRNSEGSGKDSMSNESNSPKSS